MTQKQYKVNEKKPKNNNKIFYGWRQVAADEFKVHVNTIHYWASCPNDASLGERYANKLKLISFLENYYMNNMNMSEDEAKDYVTGALNVH